MNIFFLDHDPVTAAQYLGDVHVRKMIIESAQMLANCYSLEQLADKKVPKTVTGASRKHSYYNHPCSKWVRQSIWHILWLVDHAKALCSEYYIINGKHHFTRDFIIWCELNIPDMDNKPFVDPPKAFKDGFVSQHEDTVLAYREYYRSEKKFDKRGQDMHIYTNRPVPSWLK